MCFELFAISKPLLLLAPPPPCAALLLSCHCSSFSLSSSILPPRSPSLNLPQRLPQQPHPPQPPVLRQPLRVLHQPSLLQLFHLFLFHNTLASSSHLHDSLKSSLPLLPTQQTSPCLSKTCTHMPPTCSPNPSSILTSSADSQITSSQSDGDATSFSPALWHIY